MKIDFAKSAQSTLGLEWEIALVDPTTGDLVPKAPEVLAAAIARQKGLAQGDEHPFIKRELLENTVELVTGVNSTVPEAIADLGGCLDELRAVTDELGVELYCQGSHPFGGPRLQSVSDKERYSRLLDRTQWWGQQMLIYGVHVHVGIDSVDKALPVVNTLARYVPHFQALTASSPYWSGDETGYASQRALIFQQLPTAGLPWQFSDWSEYEGYVEDMFRTGVVDELNEIRWDIRPVPNLGTVEMRVCDGLASLREIGAITSLTQCLVHETSAAVDAGVEVPPLQPWHVKENKWRAARYGLEAIVILDREGTERLVTEHLAEDVIPRLRPIAESLGCAEQLEDVLAIIEAGAGYQRQRWVAEQASGDLTAVVLDGVARLRNNELPTAAAGHPKA
ncbi:glutamate--cysteine ligase [Falsarthrobacter nasiphocae]|uniref:Putative glutamate--cysteine ligase 2 n=1 Tax=Falsarthrobacter nasiphocae TaxID=189863 RepID=A0AAE3YI35_9MICC|nr:glutamate--cysteine ligase [Falsarthrobacter nasiphocae]MDR6892564.1 carboxylate-amine ligase [Falsarthrobacter nasiphocae]